MLDPKEFHILLALTGEPRHGYGIQRDVLERTDGEMRLWPATLYRSLHRLEERGLIAGVDDPDDAPADERRVYYALTPEGERHLAEAAADLADWAAAALARVGERGSSS